MKRYIHALFVGVLLALTSCVTDDIFDEGSITPNTDRGLKIIGLVEDYDRINVSTRATSDGFSDSHISEMTMFIFKEDESLLQGYDANQNPISSAVNIQKSTPTFLINTSEYEGTGIIASMDVGVDIRYYKNTETDLGKCTIYIVANAYRQLMNLVDGNDTNGEIKSLSDLNNALLDIDSTLSMPKDANGDYIGFPMIGTHEGSFDLSYSRSGDNNDVAQIPMKKIFSKVLFTIQLNANQVVAGGPTPKFTIDRAEVYNVPTMARMGAYANDYIDIVGDEYQFEYIDGENDEPFVLSGNDFTNATIYHTTSKNITPGKNSPDLIEFGFYMPEHRVTAQGNYGYPPNIPDDLKQYYKPKGVENQKATFVRIHGSFTDHNGLIKKVAFDIYLGQNHTDDFDVRRNQQLTNKLVITGTTNHKDAYGGNQTNVSVDHRVNLADQGYNLYMEREAILDAHFEVRPIDIELQWGSSIRIVIPTEAQKWIALEGDDVARSGVNSDLYIDNINQRRGVRKYFTTNLISELNTANNGTILLQHSSCTGGTSKNTEYYRVWFYFDENPDVYDQYMTTGSENTDNGYRVSSDMYRMAPVELYYSGNATDVPNTSGTPVQVINFQQWNLWRVWNKAGDRYYDIEHEEEYLNNYASNAGYGPKQNGMAWGLDGLQLSHEHDAAIISQSEIGLLQNILSWLMRLGNADWNVETFAQEAFKNLPTKPLYDFYLLDDTSETALIRHDNDGLHFNQEIVSVLLTTYANDSRAKINGVQLHQDVNSAIAYCYNKNKRDNNGDVCKVKDDGSVDASNLKWFLPSIDQIEDIVSGAYDEFDGVFQDNMYWSCQPSYNMHKMDLDATLKAIFSESSKFKADYYTDNTQRARATKSVVGGVVNGEIQYTSVGSGVPGYAGTQRGSVSMNMSWSLNLNTTFDIPQSKYESNGELDYSSESCMGNMLRTSTARVRAVYRTGNGTKPGN